MYREVEASQTLLINTQSKHLAASGQEVFKFGFGQSPFMPPPVVVEALQQSSTHKEYTSVQGELTLRENIARFHADHNGLQVTPENVLTAPGSKILLFNILMAFEQADVFIAAPSWVSYAPQAKLAGHHLIQIETSFADRWRITSGALTLAAKQKRHEASILIINYPGNPDGLSYTEAELQQLASAARALNMLVISDEIYGLLDHQLDHKSFATYYPERTITTTGLSKWCGAGGWRFGAALLYDTIEPAFKQALIGIGSETYSCAPTPVQKAATVAYQNYEAIVPYLERQIRMLSQLGNYCSEQLNAVQVGVHAPQGGFYLFPEFSAQQSALRAKGITTSNELCLRLLQDTGVVLLPATAFGFAPEFLAARLAYVDFDEPSSSAAFDLKTDCPRIVEGIERMCSWLAKL